MSYQDLKNAMLAKKFSIDILDVDERNPNYIQATTYKMILGNQYNYNQTMYGSFKDVRIWASIRSDTDLYTYRTRQVPVDDDLMANFKFMDGRQIIYNAATVNELGLFFPTSGNNTVIIPADGNNVVCAQDMYFNPVSMNCTRNPFTTNIPIVYLVTNNVQHGH